MRSGRESTRRSSHAHRDGETRSLSATVLNIQRTSTEDGPGLRTTVFMKGCSLACAWCHNPEAIARRPQLVWHGSRCIGSRECVAACPENALSRCAGAVLIDHARCTACGDCAERCPAAALEALGKQWSLDALVAEVSKDRSYFEQYGGGVTVSGGEPALQAPFVAALLERCRALGLHTAVDTCGMCSASAIEAIADHADLVLYDLKQMDTTRHAELTGQPNERVLSNLTALADRMRAADSPKELWIRTPLVPTATSSDDNLLAIGGFIAEHLSDVVTRWELCAFNNLAGEKYERLGMRWRFEGAALPTQAELEHAGDVARSSGVAPGIVVVSGRARVACDNAGRQPKPNASRPGRADHANVR